MLLNIVNDDLKEIYGDDTDLDPIPGYAEFTIRYVEEMAHQCLTKIEDKLFEADLPWGCVDFEIDLQTPGNPQSSTCPTTYHLVCTDYTTSTDQWEKVVAICTTVLDEIPDYTCIWGLFHEWAKNQTPGSVR